MQRNKYSTWLILQKKWYSQNSKPKLSEVPLFVLLVLSVSLQHQHLRRLEMERDSKPRKENGMTCELVHGTR